MGEKIMENLPVLPPGFVIDKLPSPPPGFVIGGEKKELPLSQQAKQMGTADDVWAAELLKPKIYQDPEPGVPAPQWGMDNPNLYGLYGAGKVLLDKAVKPAIEAGGMAVGSIASPIVGTSLGYGIAKQGMDVAQDYYNQLGGSEPKQRTIQVENKNVGYVYR